MLRSMLRARRNRASFFEIRHYCLESIHRPSWAKKTRALRGVPFMDMDQLLRSTNFRIWKQDQLERTLFPSI